MSVPLSTSEGAMSVPKCKARKKKSKKGELGHGPIQFRILSEIQPAPENDDIYGTIDSTNPETKALSKSILAHGLREPIVVTADGFILSGHRRYAAAKLAGLETLPCRIVSTRRTDDIDHFVLLREYNRQRDKSLAVKLREELVNANPKESHRALTEYRDSQAQVETEPFAIEGAKVRSVISKAKYDFLNAALKVINDRKRFWPLSDRAIHYGLLNAPPLIHSSKPGSRYENSKKSYKALVDLLTRGRLAGKIPWNSIADTTRPVTTWDVFGNPRQFIQREIDGLLKGYYRNLMQSQPHHLEIICEKNTVEPILRPVASEFTIPLTSGRGYCSLPPRRDIANRYGQSGKHKLILLIASDFDPDGDQIAHSLARSMRDDFGISDIHPIKVALTASQVAEHKLPPVMTAKTTSINYARFVSEHGNDAVFELEALEPTVLQSILAEAIESNIDLDLYNAEVKAEENDAAFLDGTRKTIHEALQEMNWEGAE